MDRSVTSRLKAWVQRDRQPLIVLGARQVGKTYSIRSFGREHFSRLIEINFQESPSLKRAFKGDLEPETILRELEFMMDQTIHRSGQDLIFFDEIQDCPEALTALKYFSEKMPQLPVIAAGSLLGLHLARSSFPVGKVQLLHMYPMSITEFFAAACSNREMEVFEDARRSFGSVSEAAHERFWRYFQHYLLTGGLPASVATWLSKGGFNGGLKALEASQDQLSQLITNYSADIAKHSGKVNALHIERMWRNVPQQLASAVDDSTSRFKFKDVLPGLSAYRDLVGPIDWLHKAGMIYKIPICHSVESPLAAFTKDNIFKLYMFDTGVLCAMLNIRPRVVIDFNFKSYKGFMMENFVAQELSASSPRDGNPPSLYGWSVGQAEIEFMVESDLGVVPIEVKSGSRIRAKSLQSFVERYQPKQSVIISGRSLNVVAAGDTRLVNLPHYFSNLVWEILQ